MCAWSGSRLDVSVFSWLWAQCGTKMQLRLLWWINQNPEPDLLQKIRSWRIFIQSLCFIYRENALSWLCSITWKQSIFFWRNLDEWHERRWWINWDLFRSFTSDRVVSGKSRIFQTGGGGANPKGQPIIWQSFCRNLHEIERNWTERREGARNPSTPP